MRIVDARVDHAHQDRAAAAREVPDGGGADVGPRRAARLARVPQPVELGERRVVRNRFHRLHHVVGFRIRHHGRLPLVRRDGRLQRRQIRRLRLHQIQPRRVHLLADLRSMLRVQRRQVLLRRPRAQPDQKMIRHQTHAPRDDLRPRPRVPAQGFPLEQQRILHVRLDQTHAFPLVRSARRDRPLHENLRLGRRRPRLRRRFDRRGCGHRRAAGFRPERICVFRRRGRHRRNNGIGGRGRRRGSDASLERQSPAQPRRNQRPEDQTLPHLGFHAAPVFRSGRRAVPIRPETGRLYHVGQPPVNPPILISFRQLRFCARKRLPKTGIGKTVSCGCGKVPASPA